MIVKENTVFMKNLSTPAKGYRQCAATAYFSSPSANKGVMKTTQARLFNAWKRLVGAYMLSLAIGFLAGVLRVKVGHIKIVEHL